MEFDAATLGEVLAAAGCGPDVAASLRSDLPLPDQGVPPAALAAFAALLAERFGAPPPPAPLLEQGSLDAWSAFLAAHLDDAAILRAAVARILADDKPLPLGEAYVLDRMQPRDALGVARLFHAIYDDKYPVADYYVPERLVALNRDKAVVTVVARLASGGIAGHGAFYRSSPPNPAVYEVGQVLVAPEYRQTSMAFRILSDLDARSRSMTFANAFFGETVCTHLVTQKTGHRQGYGSCGLELSLMPAGAYAKEGAAGRVSCLLQFRVDRDRRMPLFAPECCRAALEPILAELSLDRDVRFAVSDAPTASQTVLTSRVFDFAQVQRLQVTAIGRDFPDQAAAWDIQARSRGLAVVQVYLSAGEPGVAFAAEILRQRGYIFGGLAPLWFGPDALMFQWLAAPPDFTAINLLTDSAKALLAHIQAEWEQSRTQTGHAG